MNKMNKSLKILAGIVALGGLLVLAGTWENDDTANVVVANSAPWWQSRDFLIVTNHPSPVRISPDVDTEIVGQAWPGDVFEIVARRDEWYEIKAFSSEPRFIKASQTAIHLTVGDYDLPSLEVRKRIYETEWGAEVDAQRAAEKIFPVGATAQPPLTQETVDKNSDLQSGFIDRYKLERLHEFTLINPALFDAVGREANQQKWCWNEDADGYCRIR